MRGRVALVTGAGTGSMVRSAINNPITFTAAACFFIVLVSTAAIGLVDEVDVRLLAQHGLRYPGIHARPEILHQLSRVRRGETSYVAACAGLDMDQLASQDATHYARMP